MKRLFAIGLFVGLLIAVPAAWAHNQGAYYQWRWDRTGTTDVDVHFTTSEWGAQQITAATHGFNNWDNAGGASFIFSFDDVTHSNYPGTDAVNCGNPRPENDVHFDNSIQTDNYVAITADCVTAGEIDAFVVVMDSNPHSPYNWDFNGNPGANDLDFESGVTHEAGHATGFGYGSEQVIDQHFTGQGLCPDNSTNQTMCDTLQAGHAYEKSLEGHDKHTFEDAYP